MKHLVAVGVLRFSMLLALVVFGGFELALFSISALLWVSVHAIIYALFAYLSVLFWALDEVKP